MLATNSRILLRTATGIGGKTAVKALIARSGTSSYYSTLNNVTNVSLVSCQGKKTCDHDTHQIIISLHS